jgi:pimeloyl-ACP methyl ester carboxylesterase
VSSLFSATPAHLVNAFVKALERDLEESPNGHSLFRLTNLTKGGIAAPLLVGGSYTDPIVSPEMLSEWQSYLKSSDAMWLHPNGHHFFHYFHPQAVSDRIQSFWQSSEQYPNPLLPLIRAKHAFSS